MTPHGGATVLNSTPPLNGLIPGLLTDLYWRAIELARSDDIELAMLPPNGPEQFAAVAETLAAKIGDSDNRHRAEMALEMLHALAGFTRQIEAAEATGSRDQLSQ